MASPRSQFLPALLDAITHDERIVGVLEYGSASRGEADEYSDCDLIIILRDQETCLEFNSIWKEWLSLSGDVLSAYLGMTGAPWSILRTDAGLLRVDLAFYHLEDALQQLHEWHTRPRSVE
ncbi:MAG: nucleotidyltransferase domain-containing protein, partial [Planctomycetes bacterium]|nr:nucleotidyltransferase domain-containing protein [Planctomycetota bacterium]